MLQSAAGLPEALQSECILLSALAIMHHSTQSTGQLKCCQQHRCCLCAARCALLMSHCSEKEYYLLMLSQPRPAKPAASAEPPLAALSHLVGYGSTAINGAPSSGGSHMIDKLRRITLDKGEGNEPGAAGTGVNGWG